MVFELMNERFIEGGELVEFVKNNHIAKGDIQAITSDIEGCDLFYWRDIFN